MSKTATNKFQADIWKECLRFYQINSRTHIFISIITQWLWLLTRMTLNTQQNSIILILSLLMLILILIKVEMQNSTY